MSERKYKIVNIYLILFLLSGLYLIFYPRVLPRLISGYSWIIYEIEFFIVIPIIYLSLAGWVTSQLEPWIYSIVTAPVVKWVFRGIPLLFLFFYILMISGIFFRTLGFGSGIYWGSLEYTIASYPMLFAVMGALLSISGMSPELFEETDEKDSYRNSDIL